MSISVEQALPRVQPVRTVPATTRPGKTWLVSPWFDLLFVGFGIWPIIVLAIYLGGASATDPITGTITFWQVYFLTTPHRWITLALVFLDPAKFSERPRAFVGLALTAVVACGVFWLTTGTLAFLLAVDFVWNAWHFAAQHSGIHRIYGRSARPDVTTGAMFEKTILRIFLLYVIFRMVAAALPPDPDPSHARSEWLAWVPWLASVMPVFQVLDGLVLVLPAMLLVHEFRDYRPTAKGRIAYLLSLFALYIGILFSVHYGFGKLMLCLGMAVSMFHATEYLAIVSWSVQRKKNPSGVFAHLAPRWAVALVTYMSVLAISAYVMDQHLFEVWLFLNLVVALLHYAYDGMIWKQPRPAARPAAAAA